MLYDNNSFDKLKSEAQYDFGNDVDIRSACFSLYAAGIRTAAGQKPYRQGTLRDVYKWMITPKLSQITAELRSITDEKQQKKFKANRLPFATFSGTFSHRNANGLLKHSGLVCFDFDHLGGKDSIRKVRNQLVGDVYFDTDLCFTSPRGDGLKWVTHIDLSRAPHEVWYKAICRYLNTAYGLEPDPAPSSVASACFLCADPNMIINPLIADF